MKIVKSFTSVLIAVCITLSAFCISANAVLPTPLEALSYPNEAVTEFTPEILKRGINTHDADAVKGYDDTGLYISPYWTCFVEGKQVDAYASLSYDYKTNIGVLHSFSCVWTVIPESGISVELESINVPVSNAVILPESNGVACMIEDNKVVFNIKSYGSYTCLINNDSQEYAFTLFIKEYTDENAEIEAYKQQYGNDRVLVFDKGYYEKDKIDFENYSVVYFRRGSYFLALPKLKDDFIRLSEKENIKLTGYGTFDFTQINHKEKNPVTVNYSKNCTLEGLNIINSPIWTFTVYASDNIILNDISIIAYRENSDGINICGCKDVNVQNSFIRNGDDSYSVKTTNELYEAENITFDNCIAWSTKARCFGITGEVVADISNVTFKNCAVIYRNAVWDNNRVSSLAIVVENGKGNINNVKFEDIEIYRDEGRAINCLIYGDDVNNCTISGVEYKNISADSNKKSMISSRRNITFRQKTAAVIYKFLSRLNIKCKFTDKLFEFCNGNSVSVSFDNVEINSSLINKKYHRKAFSCEGITEVQYK